MGRGSGCLEQIKEHPCVQFQQRSCTASQQERKAQTAAPSHLPCTMNTLELARRLSAAANANYQFPPPRSPSPSSRAAGANISTPRESPFPINPSPFARQPSTAPFLSKYHSEQHRNDDNIPSLIRYNRAQCLNPTLHHVHTSIDTIPTLHFLHTYIQTNKHHSQAGYESRHAYRRCVTGKIHDVLAMDFLAALRDGVHVHSI